MVFKARSAAGVVGFSISFPSQIHFGNSDIVEPSPTSSLGQVSMDVEVVRRRSARSEGLTVTLLGGNIILTSRC